ncbi:unnamed protein product [Acanthoscelides obtectus]|uniref:Uncharacterized protein n=1 Tax=Acanthoscelides obtectus TaxID=200917 RepID=A0A9P0MFJ3_ACAOB|nr:unnamed protein product [Acanthoscelides obtectus]CAK1660709.1 hypothetical protein AOBTE_LOCUS22230 [Acanthoscelides obtectus]
MIEYLVNRHHYNRYARGCYHVWSAIELPPIKSKACLGSGNWFERSSRWWGYSSKASGVEDRYVATITLEKGYDSDGEDLMKR